MTWVREEPAGSALKALSRCQDMAKRLDFLMDHQIKMGDAPRHRAEGRSECLFSTQRFYWIELGSLVGWIYAGNTSCKHSKEQSYDY